MSGDYPRTLVIGFGQDIRADEYHEITDFEDAVLTFDRNGGYVDLTLRFVRPFLDWQYLDNYAHFCHFYFNNSLVFEGRIRGPESDADSGEMTVTLEGRVGILKRIYETISIQPGGEYDSYFTEEGIDIGSIVQILYEQFIRGSEGGATMAPPGFAVWVADCDIDLTGIYRDSFEWDGGSLYEVLQSLAEEANNAFWGFLEPYLAGPYKFSYAGRFYFKMIETEAGYSYRRRIDVDGPYITDCRKSFDFGWSPNEVRVRGGMLATGQRFVYAKRAPAGAGYGIKRMYAPDVRSTAAAETLCDRIFAQYEEIGARLSFTVVSLAEFPRPWKPIRAIDVSSLTIGVGAPEQIRYSCNEILEARIEAGDPSQVNHSPIALLKSIADEQIEKAERPPYLSNQSALYQQTAVAVGLPVSQNEDGTFQVELTEPDGETSLGITLDSVPVFTGHSEALQTDKPVKLFRVYNRNDDATAQWFIDNGFQVAT